MTQTANVIGTAQYLSPEQARGESVDARSDVYSTGCLLYELVTGVPPFQGDSPVAVAYQHVRENPVMPSARNADIPRVLDSIVMKALAKNPLNRYQSAGDMRSDLMRAIANQPVTAEAVMTDAERTQFIARTPPPPVALRRVDYAQGDDDDGRRTGLIWAAVVIALLLVIGVAAYAIVFLGKDSNSTKTVTVPTVVGQKPTQAELQITNAHLHPSRGSDTNGPCANGQAGVKGTVCTLEPAEGEKVKDGSTVTYHVYTPKTVQVPYVIGKPLGDANNLLHDANLTAHLKHRNSTQTAGTVLSQDPVPYTTVAPNSKVTLFVSTGKVPLPDVRGMTFDEAMRKLNSAGFTHITTPPPTTTTTDASKANKVASESPTPKLTYSADQQITLTVYTYQPPPSTACNSPSVPGGSPSAPVSPSTGASGSSPTC
jgi:serine/threonine-protein kinase